MVSFFLHLCTNFFNFYYLNIGDAGVPGAPGIPGYSYGRKIGVLLENLL